MILGCLLKSDLLNAGFKCYRLILWSVMTGCIHQPLHLTFRSSLDELSYDYLLVPLFSKVKSQKCLKIHFKAHLITDSLAVGQWQFYWIMNQLFVLLQLRWCRTIPSSPSKLAGHRSITILCAFLSCQHRHPVVKRRRCSLHEFSYWWVWFLVKNKQNEAKKKKKTFRFTLAYFTSKNYEMDKI